MKMNICYGLLKRYDNIVSVFTDDENSDVAIVEKTTKRMWYEMRSPQKERYLVTFNFLTCPCCAGEAGYGTLDEAREHIYRLRPHAIEV